MTHHESGNGIINTLENFFKRAPTLPASGRETIVKITPFLALIFGVLGILGSLAGLGLLTVFSPLAIFGGASGVSSYGGGFLAAFVWLVASVLLLAAYPGTKARKYKGWNLLFWSECISIIGSILAGSIINALIGGLIGFYLLFQIKSYYK